MRSGLTGWVRRNIASPRFLLFLILLILIVVSAHFIGNSPAGLSPAEATTRDNSQHLSNFIHHPINAPHNVFAYGVHAAGIGWRSALRLSSAVWAAVFLICFYWLARAMFGKEIGWMGGLILLATPLFLVSAKDGTAAIMYFWVAALMAVYSFAIRQESRVGVGSLVIASALAIYTPGLLLWILLSLLVIRKKVSAIIADAEPPLLVAAVLVALLILVPLVIGSIKDIAVLKQLLLVPDHLLKPVDILKNIGWMFYAFFIKTPMHSVLIISRLPVFNLIADVFLFFGVIAMWSAARWKLVTLLATMAYAAVVAGLNKDIALLALGIPSAAVLFCAGLRYMYIEWRRVFPRNPVAKTLALSLMWLVVAVQLAFGIRYALIAWPVTTDTKDTYVLK